MTKYNKILIIRLGAIGDVVHTTETFRSIKRKYPDIVIHYLTSNVPAELLKNDNDIDKVIVMPKADYRTIFEYAKCLRNEEYDLILNLQPSLKLRLFANMLKPIRIIDYKKTYKMHAVENFFDTAQKAFGDLDLNDELTLQIPDSTLKSVSALIPKDTKIVAISTQAGPVRGGKKWNIHYFKELALALVNEYNVKVLIIGSSEDKEKVRDFEHLHPNIMIYAGKFNILESAALLKYVDIMIASDTGPLHIASAVNRPICIGLYGAMAIPRTGIWGKDHFSIKSDLKCVPCQKRHCKLKKEEYAPCMDAIKPSEIMQLIKDNKLL